MGLKVTTDGKAATVYRKDRDTQNGGKFTTYCIGIASKDREGNWVNGFIDCQFKKGVEVPNKANISIANSFYNVTEYNGKKYYKIFILDFEVVEGGEVPQNNPSGEEWMQVPDGIDDSDGLPFQ